MKQSKNKSSTSSQNATNGSSKKEGTTSLLEKFFLSELKDIYNAEQQLLKGLPELQEAATTEELEDAFEHHYQQTKRHVKRLEKVFQIMDQKPEGKKCEAMEGLIKEAKKVINDTKEGTMTRDAALIIAAQKAEHYEIATYGGLVQLAITMGFNRAADLLEKTLNEEEDTDALLTEIAETHINIEAEEEGSYSWSSKETETAEANY
jgi:ferritin-like metal-binding protein YciE